jgi:flagellar biosynthesis/type III secretory pathway protein FliH
MAYSDAGRHSALERAIAEHGVAQVINRLEQVKINANYLKQTEKDIEFVKSNYADVDEDGEDGTEDGAEDDTEDGAEDGVEDGAEDGGDNSLPVVQGNDMTPKEVAANFIECMKSLNEKLRKATIDKDAAMINLIITSMTNVIKSTL